LKKLNTIAKLLSLVFVSNLLFAEETITTETIDVY
jgi:hypothetical protein